MDPTLAGIAGIVIVANLMTVWFVWSLRRFGQTKGKPEGPGFWAWVGALVPGLLAAGAFIGAFAPPP